MTISDHNCRPPKAVDAEVTADSLKVLLDDGRAISVPRAWYPRLEHGKANEVRHFRLVGTGEAIHWPDLDEDIGIEGLLAGRRSAESPKSLQRWLESRGQASPSTSSPHGSKRQAVTVGVPARKRSSSLGQRIVVKLKAAGPRGMGIEELSEYLKVPAEKVSAWYATEAKMKVKKIGARLALAKI